MTRDRTGRPPRRGERTAGALARPPRPRRGAWESPDCAQLPADKLDLLEKFFAPVENQNQNRRNNQRTYRSDRVHSELDLRGDPQRRGWIGEGEKGGPCYPRRGDAQTSSSTSSSSSSSSSASWSSEESTQSLQLPPSNKNRNVIGAPGLYHPARQSRSCVDIPGEIRAGFGRGGEEEEEEEGEGGDAGSGRQSRGRSGEREGFPRIRRGQSKSEERLLGSDSEPGRSLIKTVSLERSLAFNDQVLPAPWTPKKPGSSAQLPSKGILKNGGHKPGTEGVFRKAKSMEVIWDREGSRAQGVRSAGKTRGGEQEEQEEERGTVPVFVQEKLKFSAFLNEITRQVLSPSRLSSLGLKPETPSRNQHSRSREKRREEEEEEEEDEEEEGGELLGGGPEQEEVEEEGGVEGESQGAPRRRKKKKRSSGSLSPDRCSSRRSARQGQGSSASPQGPGAVRQNQPGPSRHTDASSSPETSPGPASHGRRGPTGASRLTDASTSPELGPLLPGRGDSGSAVPASPSLRLQQRSQQHSLHPRDQRVRDEGEDSHRSQSQSHPQHSVPTAQGSRSGTSAERCGRREREEEEAGVRTSAPTYKEPGVQASRAPYLEDQNPRKTGHERDQVGSEFKSSPHHLEAELQRTREELQSLSDRYRRLREDYTSSQQTNQALEERLRSAMLSVELERKNQSQRISELTEQLSSAQNTICTLETINIPSLLQDVLGKHFLELEDHADQSLLPPAPFMDSTHSEMELRPAGPSNQSQGRMGPVPEEDESDWLEKGGEELVPHFEFCTPHQSLPVPSLDTTAPRHGKLTRDSPAGDQGYRNKPHPQAHRGCSGSLSSPLRLLSTSLEEIRPTTHRPTDCHLQPTEGLQDLHQPLGESPEDSDDSESPRGWKKSRIRAPTRKRACESAQRTLDGFIRQLQPPLLGKLEHCSPRRRGGERGEGAGASWDDGTDSQVSEKEEELEEEEGRLRHTALGAAWGRRGGGVPGNAGPRGTRR
ncbi:filaggrin-2-like [Acipenser ruthenus]|uniref:filaggrin-2-like n=1 Tax=Acipenser ruthenus TaxID=7906 RepID=UPI002741D8DA|nr:filaggrin-2-like [Acipenser ruthenus]